MTAEILAKDRKFSDFMDNGNLTEHLIIKADHEKILIFEGRMNVVIMTLAEWVCATQIMINKGIISKDLLND